MPVPLVAQDIVAGCLLSRKLQHTFQTQSMAFPSTPAHPRQLNRTSSEPSSAQSSWHSLPKRHKGPFDTPCTKLSQSSTNAPHQGLSDRKPSIGFVDPPARPVRNLRRKSSIFSLALLRSKSHSTVPAIPNGGFSQTSIGEQARSSTRPRWWSSNRPRSENGKQKLLISPPKPVRPEALFQRTFLEQDLSQSPDRSSTPKNERRSDPHPVAQSKVHIRPYPEQRLADLDPDKEGPAFARIHPEGWGKVIPKQWMEDQFSHVPSETDEEKSVYSQDNGEEEFKRRIRSGTVTSKDENGFLAGEMMPFVPVIPARHTSLDDSSDRPGTQMRSSKESQELPKTPRWPFQRSSASSSSTSAPVRHWLSSLRPPSDPQPVCPPPIPRRSARRDPHPVDSSSVPSDAGIQGLRSPFDDASTANSEPQSPTSLRTRGFAASRHDSDTDSLVPRPLTFRRRRNISTVTAINTKAESTTFPEEISPHNSSLSGNHQSQSQSGSHESSWSSILGAYEHTDIPETPESPNAPAETATEREDHKYKALPPLPCGIHWDTEYSPDHACSKQRLDQDIDEIIDLYHYDPTEALRLPYALAAAAAPAVSSTHPEEPPRIASFPCVENSRGDPPQPPPPPPKRPPRPSETTQSFPQDPQRPFHALDTDPNAHAAFVASYLIFYDAQSYPELQHGRQPEEGDGEGQGWRSGRAVLTFVDEGGGAWI